VNSARVKANAAKSPASFVNASLAFVARRAFDYQRTIIKCELSEKSSEVVNLNN
jgi:hypothetical protein